MNEEQAKLVVQAAEVLQAPSLLEPELAKRVYSPTSDPSIWIDDRGQQCYDLRKITVLQGRGRREFEGLLELSADIKQNGLINPIHLCRTDADVVLIAGERRFRAYMMTGQRYIPFTWGSNNELSQKQVELAENIYRQDLSTLEKMELYRQIHEVKTKLFGKGIAGQPNPMAWTIAKTAELTGTNPEVMRTTLKVAKRLHQQPDLKEKIGHLPLSRMVSEIEKIDQATQFHEAAALGTVTVSAQIELMDALQFVDKLDDGSVQLVCMDPPFGNSNIEMEKGSSRQAVSYTGVIKDTDNLDADRIRALMFELVPKLAKKMKLGGHLYCFFAFEHYEFLFQTFTNAGFIMDRAPLIWDKERTTAAFMGYSWPMCYEPILFGQYMEKKTPLVRPGRNILRYPALDSGVRSHPFHKPPRLLMDLIHNSSNVGDLVVDYFCGSGETIRVAKTLNRNGRGCEIDQDNWARCQMLLATPLELKVAAIPKSGTGGKGK